MPERLILKVSKGNLSMYHLLEDINQATVSHFSYAPLIKCKITQKRNVIFFF